MPAPPCARLSPPCCWTTCAASSALRVNYLDPVYQESLQQLSSQRLCEPWAIDEAETMTHSFVAFPRSERPGDSQESLFVSGRGGFGLYLRRSGTLSHYAEKLSVDETELVIRQLFETLRQAGLVEVVQEAHDRDDVPGYQIPAVCADLEAGDGTIPFHDPIRMPRQSSAEAHTNAFFVHFYRELAASLRGLEAREHTAQVKPEDRIEREDRFRDATLPILFCSPTMELGVDIAQLNAVNMRNVPPTPANYAQRSGRPGAAASRRWSSPTAPPAVRTTSTSSSGREQMVAGAVAPPRLDLANEDLVRAHVHAVWLAETGLYLGIFAV